MGLKLVYAKSADKGTEYVNNFIKKLLEANEKVILLVPEQYTHIAEKNILSFASAISRDLVDVLSFNHMAYRMMKEVGGNTKLQINNMGKSLIISDIISKSNLKLYSKMSAHGGFVNSCMEMISELKQYNISPDDLLNASKNSSNDLLSAKMYDLHQIYDLYLKQTSDTYSDAEDVLQMLYTNLEKYDIFNDYHIIFDEFSSFIPKEYDIIKKLIEKCKSVHITLCIDESIEGENLFAPPINTANKLIDICKKNHFDYIGVDRVGISDKSDDLLHLERNLYRYPAKTFKNEPEDICVRCEKNPVCEVEMVASDIISLCRDKDYRFKDIAVICSDISTYEEYIKTIFPKYGISYFLDCKKDILEHQVIVFILGILDIYINNYNHDSIFSFLKSGFTDISDDDINLIENYSLENNITKTAWVRDDKWNYIMDRFSRRKDLQDKYIDKINNTRKIFIESILPFHEKIKGRNKSSVITSELYNFLVKINLPEKLEEYIRFFDKNNYTAMSEEYKRIWEIVVNVFDEMVNIVGDKRVNVEEYRNLLYIAFSQYKLGLIPTSLDEVVVGNTDRTKIKDVKALFVLGANDRLFPAVRTDTDILSDKDRDKLLSLDIEIGDNSKTKSFYDDFIIYNVLTIPNEKLIISFSATDAESKSARPALVITLLQKIFPKLVVDYNIVDVLDEDVTLSQISNKETAFEIMCENITKKKAGLDTDPIWDEVYDYYKNNGYDDVIKKIEIYRNHKKGAKNISKENIDRFFAEDFGISISRMQKYKKCKYSYFLENMLNIREKKKFNINPADLGTFVHGVLEKIGIYSLEKDIPFADLTDEFIYLKIDEYMKDFISELLLRTPELSKRNLFLISRFRRAIFLCVSTIRNQIASSKFEPLGYEIKFGNNEKQDISIKLENRKTVHIHGIIDRADKYETENGTFIRVVDYKTGAKTFKLDDIFYGFDIQLMVYLNALTDTNEKYIPSGALYFKIDDPILKTIDKASEEEVEENISSALKMKGILLDDENVLNATDPITAKRQKLASIEQFMLMKKHLNKVIKDICTSMSNGDIGINPCVKSGYAPCDYCEYHSICNIDNIKTYENISRLTDEEVWKLVGGDEHVDK